MPNKAQNNRPDPELDFQRLDRMFLKNKRLRGKQHREDHKIQFEFQKQGHQIESGAGLEPQMR